MRRKGIKHLDGQDLVLDQGISSSPEGQEEPQEGFEQVRHDLIRSAL